MNEFQTYCWCLAESLLHLVTYMYSTYSAYTHWSDTISKVYTQQVIQFINGSLINESKFAGGIFNFYQISSNKYILYVLYIESNVANSGWYSCGEHTV